MGVNDLEDGEFDSFESDNLDKENGILLAWLESESLSSSSIMVKGDSEDGIKSLFEGKMIVSCKEL
jgi:hypothetical protein